MVTPQVVSNGSYVLLAEMHMQTMNRDKQKGHATSLADDRSINLMASAHIGARVERDPLAPDWRQAGIGGHRHYKLLGAGQAEHFLGPLSQFWSEEAKSAVGVPKMLGGRPSRALFGTPLADLVLGSKKRRRGPKKPKGPNSESPKMP